MGPRSFDRGNSLQPKPSVIKDLALTSRAMRSLARSLAFICHTFVRRRLRLQPVSSRERDPAIPNHLTARAVSTGDENGILPDLAFERPCQYSCLDFQQAPITHPIFKQGMSHQCIHPKFISPEEAFSSAWCQCHAGARLYEIVSGDHTGVDSTEHGRIRDQRPERLHQVEGECGSAETRLMIEAHIRIKSHR